MDEPEGNFVVCRKARLKTVAIDKCELYANMYTQ